MRSSFIIILSFFALQFATANVKPSSLFSDHMVLQKGVPVPIWGTADEGEKVSVSFNGITESTISKNGKWMIKMPPMPYVTTPGKMIISGKDTVTINDILVGEVWLCSGQSNMERQLGPRPPQQPIKDWEKERDAANYPSIREYYVPLKYSGTQIDDVKSKWTVCSPQTVSEFSAVAYFFAKNLYQQLQVPIGLLFSAYGGTPAEDWTSKAALEGNPKLTELARDYDKIMGEHWHPAAEIKNGLYNGMIYPLLPYAIKGVAWYQGEQNNYRPAQYPEVLSNMINSWRNDFGVGKFPFLMVQVAPFKGLCPEIREAQELVSQQVPNTALIVTTDCGNANDIHPANKQPVGERLALAARRLAYGEKIECSGPVYRSLKMKGNKIALSFSHADKGLSTPDNETLKGFTIAGNDKNFVSATAIIKGKQVIVYNDKVKKPTAVRYGWANVPDVNLYNKDGLPASPFRTDKDSK